MRDSVSKKVEQETRHFGFGLSFGLSLFYISLLILLPISILILKSLSLEQEKIIALLSDARFHSALVLSITSALVAAIVNLFFGFVIAWVLIRYRFPGKSILDTLIDLPFALPTAIAGIALTAVYGPRSFFGDLLEGVGVQVAFSKIGIVVALIFVGIPFVVRTIEPILRELDEDVEHAAATLGANYLNSFRYVVFPSLVPALISAFGLAFARGLGEYGSVVFISGNMPFRTEILPLLIMGKVEQFELESASLLSVLVLLFSAAVSFLLYLLQTHFSKRLG